MEQVAIRKLEKGDIPFVINSWLKSYKTNSYFAKRIRNKVFYEFHHRVVTRILERPTAQVLLAVDPTDPSVILGYFAFERYEDKNIMHFMYVKAAFRMMGVGRELLKASEMDPNQAFISHWCMDLDAINSKFPDMTYCPYLI